MEKRLIRWELAGFLFTAAAGTLGHFVYRWSGGSQIAAAFFPVNESTWEHMKLLFVPAFFFTAVQVCFSGRCHPNFLAVRGISIPAGTALIPVLFYTYTGILGRSIAWVNIAVFLLADAALFLLDFLLLRRGALSGGVWQVLGLAVLWGVMFLLVWCTFRPPHLPLWQDPVTGGYGIP